MNKYFYKYHYLLFAAILGLVFLFSCKEDDPLVVTGNIEGTVSDIETSQAINGVNINLATNGTSTFVEQSKTTGADGKFSFTDIEAGSYKLSFKKDGFEDNSKNITLQAGQTSSSDIGMKPVKPKLTVSKSELNFGTSETSLTFQINNSGKGELNWEVKESIDWLSINPSIGTTTTESASVSVNINRENVDPGNYERTISVTSNGGNVEVLVKVVIEGPRLDVNPVNLDFGSDLNKKSLLLRNIGVGSLDYTVTTDAAWISIIPNSGNLKDETDQIEITVNRNGLNYGNYSGTISIISKLKSVVVDVQMIVPDPNKPQLSISPKIINFGTRELSATVIIKNSGNGILEWSLTDNQNWIDVNTNSGSLTSGDSWEIIVTVDRTGLSPNKYAGFVNVTSNGGTETCNIEMEIPAEPILFFEPDILNFGYNIEVLTFLIKNIGTGNLNWNLSTNKEWIKLSETSGTNQSSITATLDRTKMVLGLASGQVSINTNGGSGSVTINAEKRNPNTPPVVDFNVSPLSGFLETNFVLNVTCSDDYTSEENLLVRWKWQGSDQFSNWSSLKSGSHTYTTSGTKNITVEVKDEDEAIKILTKSVEVNINEKPVASFIVTPLTGTINTEFVVDATNSSDDFTSKENLQIRWQWEDNTSFTNWTTTKTASHTYTSASFKTITLELKDETGLIGTSTQKVTILDSEKEPNNASTEAQILNLNSTLVGNIGSSDDNNDFYTFTATENGNFSFSIKNNYSGSANNASIEECFLYKYKDGDFISSSDYLIYKYTIRIGERLNSETVPVSRGINYLLKFKNNHNPPIPYELTTIFESIPQTDWGEPNNFTNQATSIELNSSITALIGYTDDDVDYYTFTPAKNGNFSFTIQNLHSSGISMGDVGRCYLFKYGESNSLTYTTSSIAEASSKNSGTVSLNEGVKYLIMVPQYDPRTAAPYELKTTFQ
jgi:hypothetical protein